MPISLDVSELEICEIPNLGSDNPFEATQYNVFFRSKLLCTFLEMNNEVSLFVLCVDNETFKFKSSEELEKAIIDVASNKKPSAKKLWWQ
jgi:hypothetical protein